MFIRIERYLKKPAKAAAALTAALILVSGCSLAAKGPAGGMESVAQGVPAQAGQLTQDFDRYRAQQAREWKREASQRAFEAQTERARAAEEETLAAMAQVEAEQEQAYEEELEAARAADPYWDRPDIDPDSWEYILANPWNDIGDYTPELASLEGQRFDVRIVDAMRAFAQAARAEGLSVFLSSGYRSYAEQTYLFNRKAAEYGEAVAATIVARPGTSEHQTGLCCDITDRYYEQKDRTLENTALYQWMSAHCQEYGFIVRFPDGREDVTGIIYEPWHFRYVGVEAAEYITEHDLTLEEFLDLYRNE